MRDSIYTLQTQNYIGEENSPFSPDKKKYSGTKRTEAETSQKTEFNNGESKKTEEESLSKTKIKHPILVKIDKMLNHWSVTTIMTIWTLYALFGDDIDNLFFTKSSDVVFWSLTICAMFFFMVELVLSSIAKEDYFMSFYFWLDLISTLSLILDLGWFWNAILGTSSVHNAK